MIAAIAVVLGALEGPGVMWIDAYELDGGSEVTVAKAGTYAVWAWVKGDEPAALHVGDTELQAPAPAAQASPEYVWVELGDVPLEAGTVRLACSGLVASVFLSTGDATPMELTADTRVFDQPRAIQDARLTIDRDTNTRYAMTPFDSLPEWEAYAKELRRRILVSSGLWPLPERTPLNPVVFDEIDRGDYTVAKAYIEAWPGFFVTGNLYRPRGDGPFPAIACPHGHWGEGRLNNDEMGSVPARCITFARMGIVSFSYDMIGYKDSRQFDHSLNIGGESLTGAERNRLALWGIHPFALQLWSSVRVVDFLEGLPYVDAERIGCTGASGGGTQTFALAAIDPRIKIAAPVNMISCTMQGGCSCENAPIIRFNASNMEIGALAAPRPLLMVSATGDWTKETPEVEYAAIRSVYALYGAEDRVEQHQVDAGHNYNQESREAVYRFFGRRLLGEEAKYADFTEPPYEMEPVEALRVFPNDDSLPPETPAADRIIAELIARTAAKWQAVLPQSPEETGAFRREYGPALQDVLGTEDPDSVKADRLGTVNRDGYSLAKLILTRGSAGDQVPALLYEPGTPTSAPVLVVHGEGKAALADLTNGGPGECVTALLAAGHPVLAIDAFLTGEHHSPLRRSERVYKKYPDTFLPTDTAYRVQDVLTALAFLRTSAAPGEEPRLIGLDQGALWCLLAAAVDGHVPATALDAAALPADDEAWVEDFYVPCIRGIGSVSTAAAIIAPRPLAFVGADSQEARPVAEAYAAAAGHPAKALASPLDAVAWLDE